MLRFPVFSKVWRAMFSAQVNMNSEFTSIPRPSLVKRDSRHKFCLQKELRRYEPRSIFPQKTAFSTPFRGVLPHPAAKSALRAEGATHSLAAKKPGWPQRSPGQCSSSPRRPDHGVRSCADSSPLATAIHRLPDWQRPNGARSRRAARMFQYVTEKAIRADKINGFLPARRRPFVDHSHVAGGAQRQASSGQAPSPELNGESRQSK